MGGCCQKPYRIVCSAQRCGLYPPLFEYLYHNYFFYKAGKIGCIDGGGRTGGAAGLLVAKRLVPNLLTDRFNYSFRNTGSANNDFLVSISIGLKKFRAPTVTESPRKSPNYRLP